MEIDSTLASDGRTSLKDTYSIWNKSIPSTWVTKQIASQKLTLPGGKTVDLPIFAYYNSVNVDAILIGGIHGREPAGTVALNKESDYIVERGKAKKILVMPLLNPWGYYSHRRYNSSGQSVTDCMHYFGRVPAPLSEEAPKIIEFLSKEIKIKEGTPVLDLHEDPGYEEGGTPYKGSGTYMYIIGKSARSSIITQTTKAVLQACSLPLINSGTTRFGEVINDGIIENSLDGSIDEYLSVIGGSPVITLETLLINENTPALSERVAIYQQVIKNFLQ